MNKITFFIFIIGFGIGIIIYNSFIRSFPKVTISLSAIHSNKQPDQVKKIRILCFLNTRPANHGSRAVHVVKTWGKHCDKLLFASTLTDTNLDAIGFNVTDNHKTMWGKEKLMMQYIHKHYINDYDWFYKGDDDTFALIENMRYLLAAYSPEDPIYLSHKFGTPSTKRGNPQGGSGYVMSRKTIKIFVEKVLTNQEFIHEEKDNFVFCHIESDEQFEDIQISICLDYYNVYAGDGRDVLGRDRFLVFEPKKHLLALTDPWYSNFNYYPTQEGLDCCSKYSVAFHYIKGRYQYTLYYLTYGLKIFGIERRFPPSPRRKNFTEVAHRLDEERFNITWRG